MKLKKDFFNYVNSFEFFDILIEHLKYSIKDVNDYSELTEKEKEIISEETFNLIFEK